MHNSILSLPGHGQSTVLDSLAVEFEESLAELSASAERELSGMRFAFSRYGRELYPYFEETDASMVPGCIIPIKEGRPVASVDSTCVLVGETCQGALYAARTAVGISYEGSLRRFFRLGPILAYASQTGLSGIRAGLSRSEQSMIVSDHSMAEGVIRNVIERKVVERLLESDDNIIVMADGSLRHPMGMFEGSQVPTNKGGSCLVGFSKSSNLIFSEGAVGALTRSVKPSFFVMDGGALKTVLAKFTADGLVFRLDVPEDAETVATTLGRILWNDAFASGYPDSLKVAHHLSVFTFAEDQALKALVTKRFNLRHLPTFSLRRIALGSFRGGA
jgi:hypothetical protein